jgi:glycosyltransferase involved in cell wall biosynthesis
VRVLFVSHYAVPHTGGIEIIVDRLARELTTLGHEVTHVASDSAVNHSGTTMPYRRILVPAWQVVRDRLALPYPIFAPHLLWKTLKQCVLESDIVHAHGMLYLDGAAAFAIDRRLGRNRRVLTEHVGHIPYESRIIDGIERIAIRSIGRYTARAANAIITYNGRVAREMKQVVPGSESIHIENGIDTDLYHPPVAGERERLRQELGWDDRPRVLFVGRLVEKKGIRAVLETALRAEGTIETVLAGPGRIEQMPAHVQNFGELPPERVAALYRAADVFLLPSRGEGFPLSAQEAMASGLPVILGDDRGYEATLAGAERAFRLVDGDPDRIIAAVRELLDDRPFSGRAAREYATRRPSWSSIAAAHERVYENVIRVAQS